MRPVPHHAGNYALYSVTGTHQGVTTCLTCHAPAVATTFANITIVSTPSNHIPIGTPRLQPLRLPHDDQRERRAGSASARRTSPPRRSPSPATPRVATAVTSCQTCHQTAAFAGMVASTSHDRRGLAALGRARLQSPRQR